VPLPWSGNRPPFGFTADDIAPWLPQPAGWAALTVAAQRADPDSTLSLYRSALHLRRELRALRESPLAWQPSDDGVLVFDRGPSFRCVVNLSTRPVALEGRVLLASGPCSGDLPPDTAAWLETPGPG
jgi:alpha-glucosidase